MPRARALSPPDVPFEPELIEGIPAPKIQRLLFGHGDIERSFLDAYRSGRMHHAWLLTGRRGIGKATFAFRAAKFLLANGDPSLPAVQSAETLELSDDNPTERKVLSGGHGQLLHMTRDWDFDRKRFKQDLTVDVIRKTTRFFGSTASEGGWRIAIVDAADDMNASSANALLKILEEPPQRSIFFVLAHVPGRLLPTIRSRCRVLPFRPLSEADLRLAISSLTQDFVDDDRLAVAIDLASGSVRQVLDLLLGSGLSVVERVDTQFNAKTQQPLAIHALADQMGRGTGDEVFAVFCLRLRALLQQTARDLARSQETAHLAVRYADAVQKIDAEINTTEAYNLDRRQLVLSVFRTLAALKGKA